MYARAYSRQRRTRDIRRAADHTPTEAVGMVTMHAGQADQFSG